MSSPPSSQHSPPIYVYDRQQQQRIEEKVMSRSGVDFLYAHPVGRLLEHYLLSHPLISKVAGHLKSRQGKKSIQEFIDTYHINTDDMTDPVEQFETFGEFFIRKLTPEARPLPEDPRRLIAAADARLLCFPVDTTHRYIPVKGYSYSLYELLENRALAQQFAGGWILIYRLAPVDYHRYCYIDDGVQTPHVTLQGRLHSVNPVAIDTQAPIFARNAREYCLLKTRRFGTVLHMDVGALIVGKIVQQHPQSHRFNRGEEKGYFEFGGSTIIQIFMPGKVTPDADLIARSVEGIETLVQYGSGIGMSTNIEGTPCENA